MQAYNFKLEESIQAAFNGSKEAAQIFFESFLAGPLFIPTREQVQQITNQADYPNDLITFLALKAEGHNFVMVFSRPEKIKIWANSILNYQQISGGDLINRIAKDYWVAVNPGDDYEKEISAWELEQLKFGKEGIPIIINELYSENEVFAAEIKTVNLDEYNSLITSLKNYAKQNKNIKKMYLVKEEGKNKDEKLAINLILGVEAKLLNDQYFEQLKDRLRLSIGTELIGNFDFKIRIGTNVKDSIMLGMFKNIKPFFVKSWLF